MLIECFSSLFDEIGLNPNQRRNASRALVRTLCKLGTYRNEVDAYLRKALGKDLERRLFHWWQQQRTNRDLLMLVWRGVYCLAETGNAEYAEQISGIHQRDLRYAIAQLSAKDLSEIQKGTALNWRKAPISQRRIELMLREIEGTIKHYAYKLRFISMGDPSITAEDIESGLQLEALSLITRYECERSRLHVRNTVLRGLKSYWSETVSYSKRAKRDAMPSHEVTDCNGKHFDYESIRQPLMLKAGGDSGEGEMENPALMSKCVTMDKELETRSLIRLVRKKVPRYGKYLGICVLERRDRSFHKWLKSTGCKISTPSSFHRSVKKYCGVTIPDEERALQLVSRELGIHI